MYPHIIEGSSKFTKLPNKVEISTGGKCVHQNRTSLFVYIVSVSSFLVWQLYQSRKAHWRMVLTQLGIAKHSNNVASRIFLQIL